MQSDRVPWAFGRAFRIAAPFGSSRQPKVWSLPKQLHAGRGLVAPAFVSRQTNKARRRRAVARGLVAPVFGCSHPNKARRRRPVACG